MIRYQLLFLGAALVANAAAARAADTRYVALLADGSRVEGDVVTGWNSHPGAPKLDKTELNPSQRPLRWLRDRTLTAFDPRVDARGFLEMVNGDRLPGHIVEYDEGSLGGLWGDPPYLRVRVDGFPYYRAPFVRVLPQYVRRVVLNRSMSRRYEPGTVLYPDGRRFKFQSLRWQGESVKLLMGDEIREVVLAELAEIHLLRADPWQSLCDELAVLSPDLTKPLVRLETTRGTIVTGCDDRYDVYAPSVVVQNPSTPPAPGKEPPYEPDPNSANWFHATQPFWSLDPIWTPFGQIRTRWHLPPTEMPLSRVEPARAVERPIMARGWPWQADSNVQGGALESGKQQYAWGFGVHASNELWFEVPGYVQGFRTRVGLDRIVEHGGCVRAAVYLNEPSGQPLFQSKHLVGSDEVADSGRLALAGPPGAPKTLVLVADAAVKDRPRGADPLDVRDMVDWLEPTLYFDAPKLLAEVQKRVPGLVPAWNGWAVKVEGDRPLRLLNRADAFESLGQSFRYDVCSDSRPVTLTMERQTGPTDNWLVLRVRPVVEEVRPGAIEVRIDDRPIARFDVPRIGGSIPSLVPLEKFWGRRAKLTVVYTPKDPKERLHWYTLAVTEHPMRVRWRPLKVTAVRSLNGSKLTVQEDGSVLAGGPTPANDIYTVICESELPEITGYRLETIPDKSLPEEGAGRSPSGSYILSRITVSKIPANPPPVRGRYVRVEMGQATRLAMTLAEVQAFSGGKNVAQGAAASQSSTAGDAEAKRAVDGNTNGDPAAGSVAQTEGLTDVQPNQKIRNAPEFSHWWEVDLGDAKTLERIVIWNRTDKNFHYLKGYQVSVLDGNRQAVWQKTLWEPPVPAEELDVIDGQDVPLESARTDSPSETRPVQYALQGSMLDSQGWSTYWEGRARHVGVFSVSQEMLAAAREAAKAAGKAPAKTPAEKPGPKGPEKTHLLFKLKHLYRESPQLLLGRFRLWATSQEPPLPAEPIGQEVPLLPEVVE